MQFLEGPGAGLVLFVYNVLGAVVFRRLTGRAVNYLLVGGAPFLAVVGMLCGVPEWMVVTGYMFSSCLHVLSFVVHLAMWILRKLKKKTT